MDWDWGYLYFGRLVDIVQSYQLLTILKSPLWTIFKTQYINFEEIRYYDINVLESAIALNTVI
jgi:hypothetical protein